MAELAQWVMVHASFQMLHLPLDATASGSSGEDEGGAAALLPRPMLEATPVVTASQDQCFVGTKLADLVRMAAVAVAVAVEGAVA